MDFPAPTRHRPIPHPRHAPAIALGRFQALAIVTLAAPSTPSLRDAAWQFLAQWGAR